MKSLFFKTLMITSLFVTLSFTLKTQAEGDKKVWATVNGQPITDEEITKEVQGQLKRIEAQIFDIKMDALDNIVDEKLVNIEAEKLKITPNELIKKEIKDKVGDPKDEDLQKIYDSIKGKERDQPFDQLKPRLTAQWKRKKEQEIYNTFIATLKKKYAVSIMVDRPRANVTAGDDPFKGNPKAKVVLIEYTDFQCPYCKKARPVIDQILSTYGDKVKYVFKDFPLSFHQKAPKAHQANNCAGDQKKYWEYNTLLWEAKKGLDEPALLEYAKGLGLDEGKFKSCLDSNKYASEIDQDISEGSEAGVTGTPAYFINGISLKGAQPFESFKKIIDEELNR